MAATIALGDATGDVAIALCAPSITRAMSRPPARVRRFSVIDAPEGDPLACRLVDHGKPGITQPGMAQPADGTGRLGQAAEHVGERDRKLRRGEGSSASAGLLPASPHERHPQSARHRSGCRPPGSVDRPRVSVGAVSDSAPSAARRMRNSTPTRSRPVGCGRSRDQRPE